MKTSEVNSTRMIGKKPFVGNDVRERCEWVTVAFDVVILPGSGLI